MAIEDEAAQHKAWIDKVTADLANARTTLVTTSTALSNTILQRDTAVSRQGVAEAKLIELQAKFDAHMASAHNTLPGWTMLKQMDFSKDEGWVHNRGNQGRDSSICRPEQALFGQGANGKQLVVRAERATATSPIYAVDMKFMPLKIPSHFRASVTGKVSPMAPGMWPAMLWLRPNGPGQGEIDIHEAWGMKPAPRSSKLSMIWTPYTDPVFKVRTIKKLMVEDPTLEKEHTWTAEKRPGEIRYFVDGAYVGVLNAQTAKVTQAEWDSMWEAGTQYYPRITFQVGPSTKDPTKPGGGPIDPKWLRSEMTISSMAFWELAK